MATHFTTKKQTNQWMIYILSCIENGQSCHLQKSQCHFHLWKWAEKLILSKRLCCFFAGIVVQNAALVTALLKIANKEIFCLLKINVFYINYTINWYKIHPAGNLNHAQVYKLSGTKKTVQRPLTFHWKQQKSCSRSPTNSLHVRYNICGIWKTESKVVWVQKNMCV